MKLFDLLFGNKKEKGCQDKLHQRQETKAPQKAEEQRKIAESGKRETERKETQNISGSSSFLLSKSELEEAIRILSKISYIFQSSDCLIGGRNETMKSKTFSYVGILGFYYEVEYHYGKMTDIVDSSIATHYALVKCAMLNENHKKKVTNDLADNWSDVLQVIFNLQLDSNHAGNKLKAMESDIKKVTSIFEKLSGSRCHQPKNPLNSTPRKVSYNPFNITEDFNKSIGHTIPDVTDVFAKELIPMLASAQFLGKEVKDIVADYTIDMVRSYYENAGFVPMIIVDQLTGQINQVAEIVHSVSYAPYSSLKEYVLSRIYK